MQRRGEIDRLGFGDASAPFEARDVATDAGDGGAQRLVAIGARRRLGVRGCAAAFGDALELAPVLEHRLFARGLAAREPRLGVGQRRS